VNAIAGWPESLRLLRFDSIDSTNEEARRLAAKGEQGPLWIVARTQTVGRGRRGNRWISESGNLLASVLLPVANATAAQLGFAAGLATAEVLSVYVAKDRVTLKWPNDVLVDGRKIAGILLETAGTDAVVIGIGINLAEHPSETEFPAVSLRSILGHAPGPDEVLPQLASRLHAWYEVWQSRGFSALKSAWLERAQGLGGEIRARLAQDEVHGVFETLDDNGALLLRTADRGLTHITAGEVFFGT
jgi:BirA family biotin operon repressor/biotin-[acetyl-CoA-carboxylase] ligase